MLKNTDVEKEIEKSEDDTTKSEVTDLPHPSQDTSTAPISNSNTESNSIDDNNFYIQIKLTDKAKYALLNSENFVGSCYVSIKKKKKHKKKPKEV